MGGVEIFQQSSPSGKKSNMSEILRGISKKIEAVGERLEKTEEKLSKMEESCTKDVYTQAERKVYAIRTEAAVTSKMLDRLVTQVRSLHVVLGLCSEVGEFADQLKKHIFYGKPLDVINLKEEIGDLDWYIALACDILKTTLSEIQATNIAKLRQRYPEKFTDENALERDLSAERAILETNLAAELSTNAKEEKDDLAARNALRPPNS